MYNSVYTVVVVSFVCHVFFYHAFENIIKPWTNCTVDTYIGHAGVRVVYIKCTEYMYSTTVQTKRLHTHDSAVCDVLLYCVYDSSMLHQPPPSARRECITCVRIPPRVDALTLFHALRCGERHLRFRSIIITRRHPSPTATPCTMYMYSMYAQCACVTIYIDHRYSCTCTLLYTCA